MRPRNRPTRPGAWFPPRNGAYTTGNATGATGASILSEWTDASSDEDGFRFELSTDGFSTIAKTAFAPANTESLIVYGLLFNQQYFARCYAYNDAGDSAAATTSPITTVPDVPVNLELTEEPGLNEYIASWLAPVGPNSGASTYLTEEKNVTLGGDWVTHGTVSGLFGVIDGLAGDTEYQFRVSARNVNNAAGLPSNVVSVTTEATAASPGTDNLVAYFDMADASGQLTDSHGSNDTNKVVGAVAYGQTGKVGDCVSYDAATDSHHEGTTLGITDYPITVNAWFNADTVHDGTLFFLGDGVSGTDYLTLTVEDTSGTCNLRAVLYTVGFNPFVGTTPLTADGSTWYMATLVFASATDRKLYINGQAEASVTDSDEFPADPNTFAIGRTVDSSPTAPFDGRIDEVSVFDTVALTSDEILWLYNSGDGRAYSDL